MQASEARAERLLRDRIDGRDILLDTLGIARAEDGNDVPPLRNYPGTCELR